MKNALVLGGGAIKGAFQAGAIQEILKDGFKPDGVFGVSAGALNGAFIVDRAGRQPASSGKIDWPQIGVALVKFWTDKVTKPEDIAKKRSIIAIGDGALFNKFDGLTDTAALKALINSQIKYENILRAQQKRHFLFGWCHQLVGW